MTASDAFDPVEFKRNSRAEWSSAATGWKKWLHVVEAEEGGQRQSAKLVDLAALRPGASVLDVGGGYGEPSLTAARVVGPLGRVVCTDISPEMLALARQRAADAKLGNVEFIACDAEELEFDAESFDAVLSRAALMFLPDVGGTLRRLRTFLKPGGRLAGNRVGGTARSALRGRLSCGRPRARVASSAERPPRGLCARRSRQARCPCVGGRVPRRRNRDSLGRLRDRHAGAVHGVHP